MRGTKYYVPIGVLGEDGLEDAGAVLLESPEVSEPLLLRAAISAKVGLVEYGA